MFLSNPIQSLHSSSYFQFVLLCASINIPESHRSELCPLLFNKKSLKFSVFFWSHNSISKAISQEGEFKENNNS